jgi:hypothetical protein
VGEVRLRASDADRERVAGLLGEALADGRLTVDEHRERIGILYATGTLDELTPLTADLGTERRDVERQRSAAPAACCPAGGDSLLVHGPADRPR